MKKALLIALMIFGTINLTAQEGSKKTYSLRECLDIATRQNFDVVLGEAQVRTSGADITQAFGAYLPSIDVNAGYTRTLHSEGQSWLDVNGRIAQSNNSYNINANTSLAIFDGFSREANYSRAQNQLNSNHLNLDQTIQQVRYNVYRQYIDVVRNTQLVKIRRENFAQGKKELERIQAQYQAGIIPVNVVYSQEAELGNREVEIVQAENQLNLAKTNLLGTMGLNPDYDAEFQESVIPSTILKGDIEDFRRRTGTLSLAMKNAMENRNDFKASELALEASKQQITMAKAGYMPQLNASAGWRWNYFELGSFADLGRSYAGLNLAIPVFDNFRTNMNIQNAQLQVTQQEIQKQRIELNIKQTVQNAVLNLETAEKQVEISERALKAAEKNFEATSERFRQGSANITDYTLANSQFITSQINRITAVYNYISSQKEVEFASGLLK
jgi:outer membrane protein